MTPVEGNEAILVQVQPRAYPNEAKIRVTPEYEQELRDLLTGAGLPNNRVYEFHEGPLLAVIGIAAANAFWPSFFGVVKAFINRHQGKEVRIEAEAQQRWDHQPKSGLAKPGTVRPTGETPMPDGAATGSTAEDGAK